MFTIFQEEKIISALMGLFLALSILTRLMLGMLYQRLIRETDNMAITGNKLLKQCKLKFANCFQLNNGVSNIPVFVDKFLNRLMIGHLTFDAIYHLSGQLMLLSVVCSSVGVCKSIIQGRLLGEILPFYIVSFLGLYLYFSVSTVVDIKGKKRVLKVNLVDYLENHLSSRIDVTDQDIQMLYGADATKRDPEKPVQRRPDRTASSPMKRLRAEKLQARVRKDIDPVRREADPAEREAVLGERETVSVGKEIAPLGKEAARGRMEIAQAKTETGGAEKERAFTDDQEKELERLLIEFLTL